MEHIPGYKNKAANCISQLPFITRKRNDNPLKDKDTGISVIQTEDDTICFPLCKVDLTDTKTLQQEDRYCTRIAKILFDPKVGLMKKILMDMMRKEYYTILIEKMVGNTKQQWYQSFLSKQYSKKCMIILAILALERLTH